MIYPGNFEEITGFAQLREILHSQCRYESTQQLVAAIQPFQTRKEIEKSFDETDEWIAFADRHPTAADQGASRDITNWLHSLDIENFFFDEEELLIIWGVLNAHASLFPLLNKQKEQFPLLYEIVASVSDTASVRKEIQAIIDSKGKLLPYASAAYGKINAEIERLEKDARNIVRSIFRRWKNEGFTAETDITVREERLVIPILAEYKRKVSGLVKDISTSGKVLYMEPVESLELNNLLTEWFAEKKRERERILRACTAAIRPYKNAIAEAMDVLAKLDFIRVRAQLFRRIQAHRPRILTGPGLRLKKAFNPLLWLKNKSKNEETIAMDLELTHDCRLMVISGPNAGGKSISLKTAILLQYMGQCGLFVPALPESEIGIFQNISIDCGDGQSIDDGLSTFSAHLRHLKKITVTANKNSFFALDELGDGTDPRFGGPIAQAVLEELLRSGAWGVVTTHYSTLKEWASHTQGVVNASMAYDTKNLQPLYMLQTGKPGSSFAIELMRKTGFENAMMERVKELSGESSGRTEDLLLELSARQLDLDRILETNIEKQAQLDLLIQEYSELKEKINSRKKEIIEGAKSKASDLLKNANREIELTIRTIREHAANPEKTKQSRDKLKQFENKNINPGTEKNNVKKPAEKKLETSLKTELPKITYKPGMWVRNMLNSSKGEVIEVKKDKVLAVFGLIKMWVPLNEIEPVETDSGQKQRKNVKGFDWVHRQAEFQSTLDLRGIHANDAIARVQTWLDEAYALGQNPLKIIHGRGDGILRKSLREFFKTLPYIRSWRSEREEQGGDGCTIVELL